VNKKKQKNFDNFWPVALQRPREADQKFFGSFFQKRTPCFYLFFIFWTAWELQKNFINLLWRGRWHRAQGRLRKPSVTHPCFHQAGGDGLGRIKRIS
jgi:hypothetical protein